MSVCFSIKFLYSIGGILRCFIGLVLWLSYSFLFTLYNSVYFNAARFVFIPFGIGIFDHIQNVIFLYRMFNFKQL